MAENEIKSINGRNVCDQTARDNIPTKTSQLTNDSNFVTDSVVDEKISNAQLGGDTLVETILDNNLFDKNNLVTSFITKDGDTATGNFTNYIKLESGKRYVTNLNYTQFHFFDKNKNHTNTQTYISNPQVISGDGYVLIRLPSDYSKVKVIEGTDIEAYKPQHIKLRSSLEDNKWYGKKWLLIGDSISTDEADLAKNGYGKLISRELGMTLTNVSISGKTMKDGYEWLDTLSDKFDLITVMLGTNNQGYNCGIGSLNDSYYQAGTYNSNDSFYAQTQLMIEKLMTKFPKSKIIFLTPIKRTGVGDTAQYNDENGYYKKIATTKEYRDVIIDCCNYYSIPYIDLYNCIDPRTEVNRKLYFVKEDGSDGTHPNDLGHALFLAPAIKNGIIKECPYYFNEWTTVETYGDIVTSVSGLSINEGGTGIFTVSLSTAPTNDQVVALSSDNVDVTVSPTSLTFTSENYGTAQTVTISAVEDVDTTNDVAIITLSSNSVTNKTVSITVTDNDEPTATPTTYTITNNLTNCTNSNNAVSIEENASYSATLTANDGYTLDTPTITMGGTDVTSTVYSDGAITISAVTGNIVITATATINSSTDTDTYEVPSEPNLLAGVNFSQYNTDVRTDYIEIEPNTPYLLCRSGSNSTWLKVFTYDELYTQLNTPPTHNITNYYIEPNENNKYVQIQAHSEDTSDLVLIKLHPYTNTDYYVHPYILSVGQTEPSGTYSGDEGYFTRYAQTNENDKIIIYSIDPITLKLYIFDANKVVTSIAIKEFCKVIDANTKYVTIGCDEATVDALFMVKSSN